jgi:hypothetical protein
MKFFCPARYVEAYLAANLRIVYFVFEVLSAPTGQPRVTVGWLPLPQETKDPSKRQSE